MNRLFEILYLLLEKKQITAKELAEHFEVSQRTIYRDIDKLSLAGVPVYMTKGKNGGIFLMQEFVLNKALLNDSERTEIIASLQAMNSLRMTEGQAIEKLKGLFGKTELDWIEIEFSNWGKEDELNIYFQEIKEAILMNHVITFYYMNSKGERMLRKVNPAKLCFKGQSWYLYGYCTMRRKYRFFKLLRMEDVQMLHEIFEPAPIGKVLKQKQRISGYDDKQVEKIATILIKAPKAYRAYDEIKDIQQLENGDVICNIPITDRNWFYYYILSYGENCIVLGPEDIKFEMKQKLKKAFKQYM